MQPGCKHTSGNCVKCGVWRYALHHDHIVPKSRGGSNEVSNIQLLCGNCHEEKTRADSIGRKHTEATKEKMRQKALGRRHTAETCVKMSRSHTGVPLSAEHRAELSLGLMGHRVSDSCKEKHRVRMKRIADSGNHPMHTPQAVENRRAPLRAAWVKRKLRTPNDADVSPEERVRRKLARLERIIAKLKQQMEKETSADNR